MTAVRKSVDRKSGDRPPLLLRLTVAQYHNMIASGILAEGQPYELLDGIIVRKDRSASGEDPMTVGYAHATAVTKLAELGEKLIPLGCHIRIQQPITIPPNHEPEPDATVVIGKSSDYSTGHPVASDVNCVIEVADSSLQFDRTTKLVIYARARIKIYMIVNLVDRTLEVYDHPVHRAGRYRERSNYKRTESIRIPAAGGRSLVVPVRQIIS